MRTMTPEFEAALDGPIIYPVHFFEAEFPTGTLRLCTLAPGQTTTWDGKTWNGIGNILGFSEVEETSEVKATSLVVGLPATPALISALLQNGRRNLPLTIWLGLLSPLDPTQLIDDPVIVYAGLYDTGEVDIDPEKPAIRIRYESRIADMERASVRRSTHEDQQIEFPGDMFYEFTGALTDAELPWGT